MKKYFIFILILTCINARANTYYFSSSIGDDSRSVSQAQNQSTPWKSIAKLNSIFSTLNPGDNINFMRGDLFYGAILVSKSGTLSAPISIDSYGSGARPIITGFVDVVSWINSGGNIWKATGSTIGSKAFSSTYAAAAGAYMVVALHSSSANTTSPVIAALTGASGFVNQVWDFTNSAKSSGLISSLTALPSPTQAFSGITTSGAEVWFGLY